MKVNFKYIVITSLLICIFVMTTAFSIFSNSIVLRGNASLDSHPDLNWDISIVKVESEAFGTAVSKGISYERLTASFEAVVLSDGDAVEYAVTVKNNGNLDAKVDAIISNIESIETGSGAITYELSGISKGDILKIGDSQTFTIKVIYDADFQTNPLLTSRKYILTISYVQNI